MGSRGTRQKAAAPFSFHVESVGKVIFINSLSLKSNSYEAENAQNRVSSTDSLGEKETKYDTQRGTRNNPRH